MSITKSLEYINDEFEWVVDIDLEKFFEKVPQDKLTRCASKNKENFNKICYPIYRDYKI